MSTAHLRRELLGSQSEAGDGFGCQRFGIPKAHLKQRARRAPLSARAKDVRAYVQLPGDISTYINHQPHISPGTYVILYQRSNIFYLRVPELQAEYNTISPIKA